MSANHAPALSSLPPPPGDSDYESILTALMETARGRWFLSEFSQRNRNADTTTLLIAIGRIEDLLRTRSLEPAETEPASEAPLAVAGIETADVAVGVVVDVAVIEVEPAASPEPEARDPFADIRALSDEEKIALFT
jgi:hypothetical protein